jgi:hypothetical protein
LIDNSVLKVDKEVDKVISVLSAIIKYLFMAFCCLSVTFLFVIYAIGMLILFIEMVRSEKK